MCKLLMQMHFNRANDLLQAIGLRKIMVNIANLSQNFELHLFMNRGDQILMFDNHSSALTNLLMNGCQK